MKIIKKTTLFGYNENILVDGIKITDLNIRSLMNNLFKILNNVIFSLFSNLHTVHRFKTVPNAVHLI